MTSTVNTHAPNAAFDSNGNNYQDYVRGQITLGAIALSRLQGAYEPVQYYDGQLNRGEQIEIDLQLEPHTTYSLVGACDQDCIDFDLLVYDGEENLLGSDLLPDTYPVAVFTTDETGIGRAHALMAACRTSFCYYGMMLYEITNPEKDNLNGVI